MVDACGPRGRGEKNACSALVVVLRASAKTKDLLRGTRAHHDILRNGLIDYCVDALVTMYSKCGQVVRAKDLFDVYKSRDVFTWTALMIALLQKDRGNDVLTYFKQLQQNGLSPNAVTFTCVLKACGSTRDADKGEEIHQDIAKQGLLKDDIVLGNALVDMYAKCGVLAKARQVLEELLARDVVSWNALISGYVQQDEDEQALNCFEEMQCEGISPDVMTFTCILKACGSLGAAGKGNEIHDEIAKQGLLGGNVVLGTALLDMYARCGALRKARQVLKELPTRNATSWNAVISGYVRQGEDEEVLACFEEMQCVGIFPNAVTFTCVLKACGSIKATKQGEKIHEEIAKHGSLGNDGLLGSALVDMYAKCSALDKAQRVLEELSLRDAVSWNILIAGYVQQGEGEQALSCFERMQQEGLSPDPVTFACLLKACGSLEAADKGKKIHKEIAKQGLLADDIVLGTALVGMYVKCVAFAKARQVLQELHVRDVASWNVVMAGYAEVGEGEQTLSCFKGMQWEGITPDAVTYTCILKACGSIRAIDRGKDIHDQIAKQGLLGNNVVLGTALVDMYAKCGALGKAQEVLEELPVRDVTSWNALIAGYAERCGGAEVLNCLRALQEEGLSGNVVTLTCALKAFGSVGAINEGEMVLDTIDKQGLLGSNVMLGTAVVDLYAKCGDLAKAQRVLECLHVRDVISWNALIGGYVQWCEAAQALDCFKQMQHEGLSPDAATFSSVLNACSRLGLVEDAERLLEDITSKYGLKPDVEHFTCMVDLLGRVGHLDKAVGLVEKLPSDNGVWSVLLGACCKWADVDIGRWAFEHAIRVGKNDAGPYVLMANMYAAAGMQQDAEDIEAMRIENEAGIMLPISLTRNFTRKLHLNVRS